MIPTETISAQKASNRFAERKRIAMLLAYGLHIKRQ
jgi:hypothetical protein